MNVLWLLMKKLMPSEEKGKLLDQTITLNHYSLGISPYDYSLDSNR